MPFFALYHVNTSRRFRGQQSCDNYEASLVLRRGKERKSRDGESGRDEKDEDMAAGIVIQAESLHESTDCLCTKVIGRV